MRFYCFSAFAIKRLDRNVHELPAKSLSQVFFIMEQRASTDWDDAPNTTGLDYTIKNKCEWMLATAKYRPPQRGGFLKSMRQAYNLSVSAYFVQWLSEISPTGQVTFNYIWWTLFSVYVFLHFTALHIALHSNWLLGKKNSNCGKYYERYIKRNRSLSYFKWQSLHAIRCSSLVVMQVHFI